LSLIPNELNPDKFEALIVWYFKRLGASEVTITSKNARDKQGDADIIAVFEPLKTIYYVQAKHHKGVTSGWAAQQVTEYKDHQDRMDDGYSKIAWVVSTAESFSAECIQLAKENSVGLFAGPDIARMILEAGIQNLDKAF
jgi:restriction endonuclease Mrr